MNLIPNRFNRFIFSVNIFLVFRIIFIPYILLNIVVIIELAAILYVTSKNQAGDVVKKEVNKPKKQETFNGFYVDR